MELLFCLFAWLPTNVQEFERFRDPSGKVNVWIPALMYLGVWFGALLFVLWKFDSMGLLPKQLADMVSAVPPPLPAQISRLGISSPMSRP